MTVMSIISLVGTGLRCKIIKNIHKFSEKLYELFHYQQEHHSWNHLDIEKTQKIPIAIYCEWMDWLSKTEIVGASSFSCQGTELCIYAYLCK